MTKTIRDLKAENECFRDLAVSVSATLLWYVLNTPLNESRAEASRFLRAAEQCFRCARLPSVERDVADYLETIGRELKKVAPELGRARNQNGQGAAVTLPNSFPGEVPLTDRERAVLAQIVQGASSREAARFLGVSARTIDFHRSNIMQKLGARNLADLVRIVLGK